jgi:PAS domain S-box-containing protein
MSNLPEGKEIKVGDQRMIVSRTNMKGIIEYANHDFSDISGYTLSELVNRPHNIVRHPDMPAAVFKLMWERLQNGQDIYAVVKNRAKNGDYYWVTTKFDIRKHPFENRVSGYVAYRQGAPSHVVDVMSKLYAQMLEIEKASGIEASEKYLEGFLDSKRLTYDQYMSQIVAENAGFKSFFKKMAGLFS